MHRNSWTGKNHIKTISASFLFSITIAVLFFLIPSVHVRAVAAAKPDKVDNVSVTSLNYNTVSVSYDAAAGAVRYQIFRADKKRGVYKRIRTTSKTMIRVTGLRTGARYYFKVRAVSGGSYGDFSDAAAGKARLTAPTVKVTLHNSFLKVSWKRIKGALRYNVYRKKAGQEKILVKSVRAGKTLVYKDRDVENRKSYKYYVQAVRRENTSGFSPVIKAYYYAKPEPTTLKSVSNESDGVRISWNRSDKASGYELYRRKRGAGEKYEKILEVSKRSTSALDKTAQSGQAYYYYVKVINHSVVSKASDKLIAKKIDPPSLSFTGTESGITIRFKKLPGIKDYELYRTGSDGKPVYLAGTPTLSKADPETYTYTDLFAPADGRKYTYGIKAIKTTGYGVFESDIRQYDYYYLAPPDGLSVFYLNDTRFTLLFNTNSHASGRLLQYSTMSDFTYYNEIDIDNSSTFSRVISGLNPGTLYYVRIRNYRVGDDGRRSYGPWANTEVTTTYGSTDTSSNVASDEAQAVIENAIVWIHSRISVLDPKKAKVLGSAGWRDDYHFTCSSIITRGYINAGVPLAKGFYTDAVPKQYLKHGFVEVTGKVDLVSGKGLMRGDVLINKKASHTGMYIGNYKGRTNVLLDPRKSHWTTQYNGSSYSWGRVFRYAGY